MELKLYDTLTRQKRVFAPLDPANVRMYVCGPTVYDFAHIGNARPVIVFDVLFRLLRHLYGPGHVTYVRNITDVDDKINARAALRLAERGEGGGDLNAEIRWLTKETYANFKADVAALGCLGPTHQPRATEFIRRADGKLDMVTLIERLIANGNAYAADGHVLFHVPSMSDYGKLSKRPLDEMVAGARVEVAPYKRDPMDFVLWKPSTPEEPGWDSPWGRGRPGWHIECSAMSGALLGETFDIHGGGVDLVFPHHENEIAQSRCAFHTPVMANYWMHNGFLMVEGEKMAKSLGNFITIRELLADWPGEVLRFNMLKTHYRQPMDWTLRSLTESKNELDLWGSLISAAGGAGYLISEGAAHLSISGVVDALSDDLNTPAAIAVLREEAKNARGSRVNSARFLLSLEFMGLIRRNRLRVFEVGLAAIGDLPLSQAAIQTANRLRAAYANGNDGSAKTLEEQLKAEVPNSFVELRDSGALRLRQRDENLEDRIRSFIEKRSRARAARNWVEADRIRDELVAMGVVLKDTKDGTTWEVAR